MRRAGKESGVTCAPSLLIEQQINAFPISVEPLSLVTEKQKLQRQQAMNNWTDDECDPKSKLSSKVCRSSLQFVREITGNGPDSDRMRRPMAAFQATSPSRRDHGS